MTNLHETERHVLPQSTETWWTTHHLRGVDILVDMGIYGHMDMSIWTYSKFLQVMVEFRPYV